MPTIKLPADIQIEIQAYPLAGQMQQELIRFLRTEWQRTDYDWLEAMNGDYSENLAIITGFLRRRGELLATATVHFSHRNPEVAVIGGVLTHLKYRDQGYAGVILETILAKAQDAGCKMCLLGTARKPHNLYSRHGFAWQNGRVMRKAFGGQDFESIYFAAGQSAVVRPANWGDLPGLTLLATQPLLTKSLDYPRGLISARYLALERCLSNFPALWYGTAGSGGQLFVIVEPDSGRVFGFGSITRAPGAGRAHTAIIDFVAHEHYKAQSSDLLEQVMTLSREMGFRQLHACVARADEDKRDRLLAAGFAELVQLDGVLKLQQGIEDVILLGRSL